MSYDDDEIDRQMDREAINMMSLHNFVNAYDVNESIKLLSKTITALSDHPENITGKDIVKITNSLMTISALMPDMYKCDGIDKKGQYLQDLNIKAQKLADYFQNEPNGDYLKDFTENVKNATSNLTILVTERKRGEKNEASTANIRAISQKTIDSAYCGLCENTSTLMKIGIVLGNFAKRIANVTKVVTLCGVDFGVMLGGSAAAIPASPGFLAGMVVGGIVGAAANILRKTDMLDSIGVGGGIGMGILASPFLVAGGVSVGAAGAGLGLVSGTLYGLYAPASLLAAKVKGLFVKDNREQVNTIYKDMLANNMGILQESMVNKKLAEREKSKQELSQNSVERKSLPKKQDGKTGTLTYI